MGLRNTWHNKLDKLVKNLSDEDFKYLVVVLKI